MQAGDRGGTSGECRRLRPDRIRTFLAEPQPAVIASLRPDGQPVSVATWYLLDKLRCWSTWTRAASARIAADGSVPAGDLCREEAKPTARLFGGSGKTWASGTELTASTSLARALLCPVLEMSNLGLLA
jgi:hypothetical protein